jgi:hypothetical protein
VTGRASRIFILTQSGDGRWRLADVARPRTPEAAQFEIFGSGANGCGDVDIMSIVKLINPNI